MSAAYRDADGQVHGMGALPTPDGFYLRQVLTPDSGWGVPPWSTSRHPAQLTDDTGAPVYLYYDARGRLVVRRT